MSFFFQGMPGMEGMGGGFGPQGGDDDDDGGDGVDNNTYYELLGIAKDATESQIKKAYRKLARQLHPDKHPGEEEKYQKKFQDLQHAYEVLSTPDKRQLYDRYGEAGLKSGGGGSGGMGDIFDMFFGGGGGRSRGGRGKQQKKKAPPIRVPLDVTLEDFYAGKSVKLSYKRYRLCKNCAGKGGSKVIECESCHGQGVQIVMQRMGFVTMQTQRQCPNCDGEGTTIRESDKCRDCKGKGLKDEKRTIDFPVPMGGKHGESVTLRSQGHEIPEAANGDVTVILRCEKHDRFQRIGADLAMNYDLNLREAMCGYNITIPHFGSRILRVKSKPGEITQPHQLKVVYGMGMPQKNSHQVKGHLYIKFNVKLPESGSLDEGLLGKLARLLPAPEKDEDEDEEEEKKPSRGNKKGANKKNKNKNKKSKKFDEEEMDVDDLEDDEDDGPIELQEEAHCVDGEPRATPYSSKSAYDEDEEEAEGVRCQHM